MKKLIISESLTGNPRVEKSIKVSQARKISRSAKKLLEAFDTLDQNFFTEEKLEVYYDDLLELAQQMDLIIAQYEE